ncbi:MAG: TIGR03087 family PEP-CTERM/XrtA system glycosyltransferase [Gammaproteobacteria bacterium]|nr:MAG: TIGR03087 family PEP-CTERM/XrtA system glycosyltransferase [Gammaproteobacteria bacterium]
MKALFVCHRFPYPPARGGKIRPFNIIRQLAGRHEVTVAAPLRSEAEREAGAGLAEHCHRIIAEPIGTLAAGARMVGRLASTQPSSFGYFYSPALARRIGAELASGAYELVFVHCSSVAPYVAGHEGAFKVLDFGDMDSEKWAMYAEERRFPLSAGYWLESVKLRRVEAALAARFDLCTCTTAAELESLRSLGTARQTGWFPNGVDTEYFAPATEPYDPDLVCFSGRMDYFPNQQAVLRFCDTVLPRILAQRPSTRFVVVGAEPPAVIRRLADRPAVTVTGTVPDVRPFVRRAAVSVALLDVARGTQNKILESMAMGVPVVCTPLAAQGVDAVPGEHLLTASGPAEAAATVLALLGDPARRDTFARAGRARVISHHSWASSLRRMEELIERYAGPAPARRASA